MAENSKIEWTDHTFNPWLGCSKVSPGCKNCYAETLMDTRYGRVQWGPQGKRIRTSDINWRQPLSWNRKAEQERRRYRVFCGSLCDVFEEKADQPEMDDWRLDLWQTIIDTPNLDWLLLTKRPENVVKMVPVRWRFRVRITPDVWPFNVWIGTSVENQEMADRRIPELLRIPAQVRFLSIEPMLGPVDLSLFFECWECGEKPIQVASDGRWRFEGRFWAHHHGYPVGHLPATKTNIDWVIVGGESGPNRRPFNPVWARSIRDQCRAADVPFFMKQVDKVRPIPDDLMIREYPVEVQHE